MYNLFEEEKEVEKGYVPLAEKMRPRSLDEFFGQVEIVGENSPIRKMLDTDSISSMIFYGPPGVGKTTLAKIIAKKSNSAFLELSAVTAGVKEIKEFIEIGKFNKTNGKKTIVSFQNGKKVELNVSKLSIDNQLLRSGMLEVTLTKRVKKGNFL